MQEANAGLAHIDLGLILVLLILGFGAGFLSGLFGIGGAVVMIPMLLYVPPLLVHVGLPKHEVYAISIAPVFFASLSGMMVHRKNRFLSGKLAMYMGGATLIGSLAGALVSGSMHGSLLNIVFAVLALLAAVVMFFPKHEEDGPVDPDRVSFNRVLAMFSALVIGVMAGLVGAGGAFLLIPVMIYLLRIPTRVTIATSLAVAMVSASATLVGKIASGQMHYLAAAALVVGSIPGAQLGGNTSKKMAAQVLRVSLAVVITLVAFLMWDNVLATTKL